MGRVRGYEESRIKDGKRDGIFYEVCRGDVLDVPILNSSRWIYGCEVEKFIDVG